MIAGVLIVNFLLLWYAKYTLINDWLSKFDYLGRYVHLIRDHPWSYPLTCITIPLYCIFALTKYSYNRISLKRKAKKHRTELLAEKTKILMKYKELNSSKEKWRAILGLSREEYLEGLRAGEIDMKDVLKAFQFAASMADTATNAIVQFVPNANEIANYIQNNLIGSKKLMGYALFVSENFPIKYCNSTHGLVSLLDSQPSMHDCIAIKMMKNHGAIPLCTTNMAQTFGLSTFNPIAGQTTLWGREVGGESGGTACMIAAICSDFAVGISMDVWGSLRMASAFCGCYSLKPTYGRHLSTQETLNTDEYMANGVENVAGFVTSSIDTLMHLWEVIWNNQHKASDYTVINLPWKRIYPKRGTLRIGYFCHDNGLNPDPGCCRAVRHACSLLQEQGHTIIEFPSPNMQKVIEIYLGHLHVQKIVSVLNVDLASVDSLYYFYYFSLVPQYLRLKFWSYLYNKYIMGIPLVYPTETPDQYLDCKMRARDLTKEYLGLWDHHCIDVLIAPGALTPAPPPDLAKKFSPLALPYISWNLMNLPAGVMPITRVTQEDIDNATKVKTRKYNYIKRAKPIAGLPLSIQVIGRPFEEEKVIYTMESLSHMTGYSPSFSLDRHDTKTDEQSEKTGHS